MSSLTANNVHLKQNLSMEIELAIEVAKSCQSTARNPIPSENVQNLCNILEAMFIHGLRDPFFLKGSRYAKYPEPNFWPFVSKYTHKTVTSLINSLSQVKSEIGKSRAWLRLMLNESLLEHYISILTDEKVALNQFYHDFAYLRDSEQVSFLKELLQGLNDQHIRATTNNALLNTWTPSPLVLAGIIEGNVVKIQSRSSNPRDLNSAAIPVRHTVTEPMLLSPIQRSSILNSPVSFEPSPSSFLHRGGSSPRFFLSSTPIEENSIPTSVFKPMRQLLLSRRTRRPRSSKSGCIDYSSKSSPMEMTKPEEVLSHSVPNSKPVILLQSSSRQRGDSESRDFSDIHVDSGAETNEEYTADTFGLNMSFEMAEDVLNETVHESNNEEVNECDVTDPSIPIFNVSKSAPEPQMRRISRVDDLVLRYKQEAEESKTVQPILIIPPQRSTKNNDDEGSTSSRSLYDILSERSASVNRPHIGFETRRPSVHTEESFSRMNESLVQSILSDGDTTGITVDFGTALREAMDKATSSNDRLTEIDEFSDDGNDENDFDGNTSVSRKKSVVDKLSCIAKERGLARQEQRCPMCRSGIGAAFGFDFGICGVDGIYYCLDCMKRGGKYSIPARVLRSWDWSTREVSDRGRAFIEANMNEDVFDLETMNPTLYDHIPALNSVQNIRERLQAVSHYMLNCKNEVAEDFMKRVHGKHYLYEDVHRYSFADLQNVRNGRLEKQLSVILKHSVGHILYCDCCSQKGFVCTLCSDSEIIHTFDTATTKKCSDCHTLYHRDCAESEDVCPRCANRNPVAAFFSSLFSAIF